MAKKEISQAAEKVAAAEKKKDKKPANPNGNVFQRAGKAIKKFCKDLKGEIKRSFGRTETPSLNQQASYSWPLLFAARRYSASTSFLLLSLACSRRLPRA